MKTLFGDQSEKCCGFCNLHHVGITPNQLKKRHCVSPTRCKHFRKISESDHWEEEAARQKRIAERKEESRKLRQKRKAEKKAYLEKLDKERTDRVHMSKSKRRLSRGTPGAVIAEFGADTAPENPFAILATKQYPNEIPPFEYDEPLPFEE